MLDDKTKICIIEKFEIAAQEFNFNFISPYCIGKNNELCFLGHLFKKNAQKGVIIDIVCEFEDNSEIEKSKYCKDNNMFYSRLYITHLLGEYNRNYFSEMLKDWEYEF